MKVLQVFNRYRERGGEEKSAERIFRHAGEVCEIERLWWDSRDWDKPGAPGKFGQLKRMFYNEETAQELRAIIGRFRPDALLCHNLYPMGSPSIYHEAQRAGIPVIQYVHNFRPFSVGGSLWTGSEVATDSLQGNYRKEVMAGAWQDSVLKSALFALLLKRLHRSEILKVVQKWICISDFMGEQFLRAGLPADQISVLRHSWDAMPEAPEPRDDGHYLFLSRLVPEKGVDVLLEGWRLVVERLGERAPKLVVGGTGSREGVVKAAAEASPHVEFVGFVDGERKHELVSGCRAMLAPSVWWEPLGLVTYEAYDHGKPMLAAASGGLTETVSDRATGMLYRPGDPKALADAIVEFERLSSAERQAMGRKGREWLLAEADPSAWKARFSEIITPICRN